MFVWFHTNDTPARLGRIRASIVKNDIGKPEEMNGEMFYLDESNNTWFKANISFFRKGSPDASNIETTWK